MPARLKLKILPRSFAIRLVTAQCALACLLLLGFAPSVSAQMQFDGLASVLVINGETLAGQNHSVVDPAGNLYISDPVNNQVLKVAVDGTASVLIPSTTTINGTPMSGPAGLALDNAGNLYVADTYNDRIVFLPPGGTPTLLAIHLGNVLQPTNLAVDASGNVYVSLFGIQNVYEISPPNGNITAVATGSYTLSNPQGLAVDTKGALYIADTGNARVLKVASGNVNVVSTGSISLGLPVGVTVDDLFNIYIADASNSQIVAAPATGTPYVLNTGSLTLTAPVGVGFDSVSNAYIMDQGNNRIVKVEDTSVNFGQVAVGTGPGVTMAMNFTIQPGTQVGGTSIVTSGSPTADFTVQSTTCTYGTLATSCTISVTFLPETPGARTAILRIKSQSAATLVSLPLYGTGIGPIIAFTPGILSTVAGVYGDYGAPSGPGNYYFADYALLSEPRDVVLDGAGDFYFVDYGNYAIRKVTPAGYITTVVGGNGPGTLFSNPANGDGGPATSANIVPLWGLALDAAGNIYDADYGWDQIREDTVSNGIINSIAGYWNYYYGRNGYSGDNGLATDATMTNPWGVVVDAKGDVIFSDYGNQVVRKVAPDGIITTIAGNYALGYGYSGDNKPATAAQLYQPEGLALDGSGNLYIADTFNNVIREVTPDGIIHTIAGNHALGAGYTGDNGPATDAQLSSPSGLTLDGGGNLYIADYGNNAIRMVTPSGTISTVAVLGPCNPPNSNNTCYTGTGNVGDRTSPLAGTLSFQPYGVAATPGGNLFFSDENGNVIDKVDVSDPPSLTFPTAPVGSSASQQDVTIQNLGTANLMISNIAISPDFTFGADTTCNLTTTETLDPGASCVLGIAFSPLMYGNFSGSITFSDNSQGSNPDTKTIPLSGSVAPETQTIPFSMPGTEFINASPITLPLNATSGLAINYSVQSGPASVVGNQLTLLGLGQVTVVATQPGNAVYSAATTVTQTFQVIPYFSPAPGSTFPGATVNFAWFAGAGVTDYALRIGSTGAGSTNLYNGPVTTSTAATVNNLPLNGETVNARLWWLINGSWQYNDYTYTAFVGTPATMISPSGGTQFGGASQLFTWNAGVGATEYLLRMGSTGVGSTNLYNGAGTTALSTTVNNLPLNGETVYVRLWTLTGGDWLYNDNIYTAFTGTAATMISPSGGSTLGGASQLFTWNAGVGATGYVLRMGSTGAGSTNLYNGPEITTLSATVNNLPINGETVYVRLWTLVGGSSWLYNDYTFTAFTGIPATLNPISTGTTLGGATQIFTWNAGVGVTEYALRIGSTGPGSTDLYYGPNQTTSQSATVPHLPVNGETVYVRLFSLTGGFWLYNDYTFTAY